MARIRSIKPEFFSSFTLAKLPLEARYLFIGLWTEADDYGRIVDSPKKIAGAVFPHDSKVSVPKVEAWLKLLADGDDPAIIRYSVGDANYIAVHKWEKHQKISHRGESRIAAPAPEDYPNGAGDGSEG